VFSGFYPYTWWTELAPSEKMGGSFGKVADQNFPPIFTGQTTRLTKLPPPYFSLFPYFSINSNSTPLTKLSLWREKSPKWRRKLESEIGGGT